MPPKQAITHGFGRRKVNKRDRLANFKQRPQSVSIQTTVPNVPTTPQSSSSSQVVEETPHSVSSASATKLSHWTKSPETCSAPSTDLSGFVTVSKANLSQLLGELLCDECKLGKMRMGPLRLKNGMCMTYDVLCADCGNQKSLRLS